MGWGESFAEGDSGVPKPGEAACNWNRIYQAKIEAEQTPAKLAPASIAQIQAKTYAIFADERNEVAERLKALELVLQMSEQFAGELEAEADRPS